ncbi:hypothetical protein SUGI_0348110 [Cryptomeria japonica]|nr:hypothetical protein SUGI_0348110 [Cryptomeria japonica]
MKEINYISSSIRNILLFLSPYLSSCLPFTIINSVIPLFFITHFHSCLVLWRDYQFVVKMERFSVMLCLFIVMSCCSVSATCYVSCFPHERDALLALKDDYYKYMHNDAAKQYSSWKGFNCCEWRGVECSHSSSHVIQLRFSNNYIADYFNHTYIYKTLVPVLFQLKHMEYLDLSTNYFIGHLPKELFGLQNLRHLDLSWNNFEGEIPMDVGSIHTLNYLNLA